MGYTLTGILVLAMAVLLWTLGWWRVALRPLRIPVHKMNVAELGLRVPHEHAERVDRILAAFAGGFNSMLTGPSESAWERYCEVLSPLEQPFAHEGAAMGYTPRHLLRWDPERFERRIVGRHDGFRYLHYVGVGFWAGMRNHHPHKLLQTASKLDPLYRHLCFDGYGFKCAFFDLPKQPTVLARLEEFDGYARNAAYQGVGRALFFHYLGEPETLIDRAHMLGAYALDVAGGVGLASVFIFPDRLRVALELADQWPQAWRPHVHLGMCFGLKARSINDPEQFARNIGRLPAAVYNAVSASLRYCDQVERQIRADGAEDGYRRWRAAVADWMAENVAYPLGAADWLLEPTPRDALTAT